MLLTYEGKKTPEQIKSSIKEIDLKHIQGDPNSMSLLIKGDNLEVMKHLIDKLGFQNKIDLVYIDPPFATNNRFTISSSKANSISRSEDDTLAYDDTLIGSQYIEFIRERLILIRELMSDRSSIYFHIDYKIGHYIKVIMDEVFGKENYLSTLTRVKCNPKNFKRKSYGNIKDMILFYSKTGNHIWNNPKVPMTEEEIATLFRKVDKDGRRYTTIPLHAPGETKNGPTGQPWRGMLPPKGRHWRSSPEVLEELDKQGLIEWSANNVPRKKIYADERNGKMVQDILEYKDPQKPSYPTEKNIELLKLLIQASSNEDSIVMDCFCGSGTTLKAAQQLGRNWIGIDQSEEAINVCLKRLRPKQLDLFTMDKPFAYFETCPDNEEDTSDKILKNTLP